MPQDADLLALCESLVRHGNDAMYRVPKEFVDSFQLTELDDADLERLFGSFEDSDDDDET